MEPIVHTYNIHVWCIQCTQWFYTGAVNQIDHSTILFSWIHSLPSIIVYAHTHTCMHAHCPTVYKWTAENENPVADIETSMYVKKCWIAKVQPKLLNGPKIHKFHSLIYAESKLHVQTTTHLTFSRINFFWGLYLHGSPSDLPFIRRRSHDHVLQASLSRFFIHYELKHSCDDEFTWC